MKAGAGYKVTGFLVVDEMAELLSPRQPGYCFQGGFGAAVHTARKFLQNLDQKHAMVKLDFRNEFKCLERQNAGGNV